MLPLLGICTRVVTYVDSRNVIRAKHAALEAEADFIWTSVGKGVPF